MKQEYQRTAWRPRWYHVVVGILAACVALACLGAFARNTRPVQTLMYPLDYVEAIAQAGQRHEVNPYWICAMIECESGWDVRGTSSAGALGLMQLLPETAHDLADWGVVDASRYDPDNLYDPETNIEYGTAYLRYLVERYHEMQPAIAAYNAGPGNVDAWLEESQDVKEAMDFIETSDYIIKVEAARDIYERLYPDAF